MEPPDKKKFIHKGTEKTFRLYRPFKNFPGDSPLIQDRKNDLLRKGFIVKMDKSEHNGKPVVNFYFKQHESSVLVKSKRFEANATIYTLQDMLKQLNNIPQLGDQKTWKYKTDIAKADKFNKNLNSNKQILKDLISRVVSSKD